MKDSISWYDNYFIKKISQ